MDSADLASEEIEIRHTGDPISSEAAAELLASIDPAWSVGDGKLRRSYSFPDFETALGFVNRIGAFADKVDHHPLITFTWGRVDVEIWTHSIGGLQRGDFVWAARADALAGGSA